MRLSKLLHLMSVLVGLGGVILFLVAVIGGNDNQVFGVTKVDALLCVGILLLITIWLQIATIHHMMLDQDKSH